MFNSEEVFKTLEDKIFSTFEELDEALNAIRKKYIRQLPPLYGAKQLFEFAQRKDWIRKTKGGIYFVIA